MNSKLFPLRMGYTLKKITATALPPKAELPFKVRNKVWFVPLLMILTLICNESFLHFIDTKVNATCYDLITGVLHF